MRILPSTSYCDKNCPSLKLLANSSSLPTSGFPYIVVVVGFHVHASTRSTSTTSTTSTTASSSQPSPSSSLSRRHPRHHHHQRHRHHCQLPVSSILSIFIVAVQLRTVKASTIGALIITYTILGVPYSNYRIIYPKTLF